MSKLFLSPHNDDAVLFGGFILQNERPWVLTLFDSVVQVERGFSQCSTKHRRSEDVRAVWLTLGIPLLFGGIPDNSNDLLGQELRARSAILKAVDFLAGDAPSDQKPRGMAYASPKEKVTEIWVPYWESYGHDQHNAVSVAGQRVAAELLISCRYYTTYNRVTGRTREGTPVQHNGVMVYQKMRALTCYYSQMTIDALGCWPHFERDMTEYAGKYSTEDGECSDQK